MPPWIRWKCEDCASPKGIVLEIIEAWPLDSGDNDYLTPDFPFGRVTSTCSNINLDGVAGRVSLDMSFHVSANRQPIVRMGYWVSGRKIELIGEWGVTFQLDETSFAQLGEILRRIQISVEVLRDAGLVE